MLTGQPIETRPSQVSLRSSLLAMLSCLVPWLGLRLLCKCRVYHSEAPMASGIVHQGRSRRPVVTAFIRRDDGKLLVVKRSDQVQRMMNEP